MKERMGTSKGQAMRKACEDNGLVYVNRGHKREQIFVEDENGHKVQVGANMEITKSKDISNEIVNVDKALIEHVTNLVNNRIREREKREELQDKRRSAAKRKNSTAHHQSSVSARKKQKLEV